MRKTFSLPVAATAAGGGVTPPPADTVDNIEHSVRLNSADSAQFTKTFSSAGNTTTNTISLWVKRNKISSTGLQSFLSANNDFIWLFDTADRLNLYQGGGFKRITTQVFRDPSAWYHFVFATDTTQSAASDRIKVYVNGQLITDWDTETALTQNTTLTWNSNVQHCIGSNASQQFPDIQIADVQNIDGLQLTPSSFGFTDSNGVWQPKAYTGSYDNLLKISSSAYSTSGTPWSNTREWDDLFAETLSDAVYAAAGATHTVTFSPALTVSSEVKITKWSAQGISTAEYVLNGSVTRTASNFTNHVDTISSATLGGSLSSITLETVGGSDAATVIELTVDGKPVRLDTITGNGFHLDFADTSSATALGNDVSGNNNDFTANNLVAGPAYTANSFSTEFDGTGDYLSIADSADFTFGTGDYTMEAWIYPTSTGGFPVIIAQYENTSGTASWFFSLGNSNTTVEYYAYSPSGNFSLSGGTAPLNTWTHVAVTRSGSTMRLFVNGSQVDSGTWSNAHRDSSLSVRIGDSSAGTFPFTGKISNVRVIKGRALYTAAFTPPSTALTATDDTVLLTCQDATVRDNSNIGHDVTASGDVAVVNEGPFNGYSGSFDGSGDYLSIPDSNDFDMGTGDFTLECWVNSSNNSNFQGIFGSYDYDNAMVLLQISNTGVLRFINPTAISQTGTTDLWDGGWHHIVMCRSGSTLRGFVDGKEEISTSYSASIDWGHNNNSIVIGVTDRANYPGQYDYQGYISNVRLTKGQALYTADFTPPTADLTTTSQGATASNVKLLTCQNSTFIDNSPSAHTITATNATTISVNPHTDKYSVTFDGNGDCLSISANTEFDIGSAKTWECWFKLNTVSTNKILAGSLFNYWLNVSYTGIGGATDKVGFSAWDGSNWKAINSTTSIAAGSWYHVAATWDGTYAKLYLNGVLEATSADWSAKTWASNNGNDYNIGALSTAATTSIDGLISNHRVTDSVLYTSNFLPSKEDLTTTSQGATASNVKLLTCQSYKLQDNSSSAHTITAVNDAKPSTDAPFVTSGAGSFDGTGDYLTTATHASDFNLGTDDFTIEFWAKTTGTTRTDVINWNYSTSNAGWADLIFNLNGSGSIDLYEGTSTARISATSTGVNNGAWHHVAVSRSGTSIKMFLDGAQIGSTGTSSYSYGAANSGLIVGALVGGSNTFNGQISNLRISKGLARYTANFTPPTEDFDPTDQDTVLLALQDNTLDDLAGDHAVTANGDAATSTVSPFEPVDGSDAMLDSPTNYGSGDTVRGNFCTLNPIDLLGSGVTLSEGNLKFVTTAVAGHRRCRGTMFVSSGKWYAEATLNTVGGTYPLFGIISNTSNNSDTFIGGDSESYGYATSGDKFNNNSAVSYGAGYTQGDTIGAALDLDAGTVVFYKNGVSQGTAYSSLSGLFTFGISGYGSSATWTLNFGQQPFKYPLAGYKSLCSTNLPTPAVADGSTAMDVALYTGNGGTQTISTPNLSPDLIWLKRRETTGQHVLTDIVRGTNSQLYSSSTNSEGSDTTVVTAFNSAGFELGSGPVSFGNTNTLNSSYVGWVWDAGSSTVSNTDGSVTSSVRANPTAGVSIVTYNGTSNSTIGHGLQAKPSLIIVKNKGNTSSWQVYSEVLGATKYLILNLTNSGSTSSDRWNDTEPTSSVFTIGSNAQVLGNCVAYCFAPVEGFSAFGSYTGNGSTDGPFVYTGFKPRWILIKSSSNTETWNIYDTARGTYNVLNMYLQAQSSAAEGTNHAFDILSNGFKLRLGGGGGGNTNGATYIYAAFAEHPFKTSRAR